LLGGKYSFDGLHGASFGGKYSLLGSGQAGQGGAGIGLKKLKIFFINY
jgi:hypothetical protein